MTQLNPTRAARSTRKAISANTAFEPVFFRHRTALSAALALGALTLPLASPAQLAVIGSYGNFDAANHEGKDASGIL